MAIALIALGSNLGNRQLQLDLAVEKIRLIPQTTLIAHSKWHETDPVGGPPQGKFLNGAAMLETSLPPQDLLQALLAIETQLGRPASREKWGPRVVDLDLLSYGDQILQLPGLEIPHPRMAERPFVLIPLAEIAPEWKHPILKKTAMELLRDAHRTASS